MSEEMKIGLIRASNALAIHGISNHWITEAVNAIERLGRDRDALLAAAKNQTAWIERHLQILVHVDVLGGNYGQDIVNGFAAAQIPDWEMKQKLEALRKEIAQAES